MTAEHFQPLMQPIVFGILDTPQEIEERLGEVLIEPARGYYRHHDIEPYLPYWGHDGKTPAMYYVRNSMGEHEVRDLTQTRGTIYDEGGNYRGKIYKAGDLTLQPQQAAVGHQIVHEFLMTYLEMSRKWMPYVKDDMSKVNLFHRFKRFLATQHAQSVPDSTIEAYKESTTLLGEVTMSYLNREEPLPEPGDLFTQFLREVIFICQTVVMPIREFLEDHPWNEFELQKLKSGDYLLVDRGDFRINAWAKEHLNKDDNPF